MQVAGISNYQNNNRINSFGAIKNIRCCGYFNPIDNSSHSKWLEKVLGNTHLTDFAAVHDFDLIISVEKPKPSIHFYSKMDLINVTHKAGELIEGSTVNIINSFRASSASTSNAFVNEPIRIQNALEGLLAQLNYSSHKLPDLYKVEFDKLPIKTRLLTQGINLIKVNE